MNIFSVTPEVKKLLNNKGCEVVLITKHSGTACDNFNEKTPADIHCKLKKERFNHMAYVDANYYCLHHPYERSDCLKPKATFFQQAAKRTGY